MRVDRPTGGDVAEGNDRQLRVNHELDVRMRPHPIRQPTSNGKVGLQRTAEPLGTVSTERRPELEGAEGPGVLQRPVDRILRGVDHVRRVVGEGATQCIGITHEKDPARLGDIEPLVRVDRRGVGELDARKEVARALGRGGGQAVGAVDVEPHAALLTDGGDLRERIDRARERRARGGDDRDGHAAFCEIRTDLDIQRGDVHPSMRINGDGSHGLRADTEQLGRPIDAGVCLGAHIERAATVQPGATTARQRPLARDGERSEIGNHASTRHHTTDATEPDELTDPADGLLLDHGRCRREGGEVDVVRSGQRLGEDTDLQPGRTDVAEEPRPRLREALIEEALRFPESRQSTHACLRQRLGEHVECLGARGRLARTRRVEALPRFTDEGEGEFERGKALVAQGQG